MQRTLTLTISIFLFLAFNSVEAQQKKEYLLQGRLVNVYEQPIADAYIINLRNHDKSTSRNNGVFDIQVLSGDSLVISHVSYFRKVVPVFQIMVNPTIVLTADTVSILQIDVAPNRKTLTERAAENIRQINFDPPTTRRYLYRKRKGTKPSE